MMAIWYEVLSDLKAYLEDSGISAVIKAGAMSPKSAGVTETSSAVFLIRDRETEPLQQKCYVGDTDCNLTLLIECWTKSADQDFLVGYGSLAALEDKVKAAISKWAHETHPYNLQYAHVDEMYGDADSQRPYVGSRMVLKVKYSI